MSTAYQSTNIYKPSEAKIRRVQTPPQYQLIGSGGGTTTSSSSSAAATTVTTNIGGITNLTLHQHSAANIAQTLHQQQQQQQQHFKHMENVVKSAADAHDSPQNSPTTTVLLTPPPPRTPTPLQQQQQQQQQLQYLQQQQQQFFHNTPIDFQPKTPTKLAPQRNRNRPVRSQSLQAQQRVMDIDESGAIAPSSSTPPLAMSLQRTFAVGELIWGPARGFPAWPGKVVKIPDNQQESVWVQWFGGGGRSNTEIMAIHLLQSLSEGLEAHHKAQKDTRKSRKLNSQLEKAIQEAMTELDRISATSTTHTSGSKQQPTSSTQLHQTSPNRANKRPIPRTGGYDLIAGLCNNYTSSNAISTTTGSSNRPKPIRIAPAPPGGSPSKSSTLAASATSSLTSSLSSSSSSSSSTSSSVTAATATAHWVNTSSAAK